MERRVLAATYRTRQLPPLPRDQIRAARRFPRRLAILAAAASVAAAAALGITQLSAEHQLDRARETAIARVVTAPDARVETARTSAGGSVTVVTSAGLREAVVSTTGMAVLPSGRVYQVWVMSPSGARSAGLLDEASLLATVAPGDRIGITIEPAGGTARPTTSPVAVLPV
jgi:Anti-sigma-K factor rskA